MNRVELADRFGNLWRTSRQDAGKSQDYMAKMLGVSKKTIQNWESGLSSPSQMKGFEWFEVLGLQPLPYYLKLLYDDNTSTDNAIDEELATLIAQLPATAKQELLYILKGTHGSAPVAVLSMTTAHLHIPLKDRLNTAHNIILDYEVAESQNELINKDTAMPDMELLKQSFELATESVKRGKKGYSNWTERK